MVTLIDGLTWSTTRMWVGVSNAAHWQTNGRHIADRRRKMARAGGRDATNGKARREEEVRAKVECACVRDAQYDLYSRHDGLDATERKALRTK